MALSQKLTDVFNKNAGKIVSLDEFKMLEARARNKTLTKKEEDIFSKGFQKEFDGFLEAMKDTEVRDDFTARMHQGIFQDDKGTYYTTIEFMQHKEETFAIQCVSPVQSKIDDALIEAIEKSRDYSDDIKQGKIKLALKK